MSIPSSRAQNALNSGQVFIVKDSWRDDARRLEGEFYRKIGCVPGVAVMRSYGIVHIAGEPDTVASRIRRDLTVHAKPRSINPVTRKMKAEAIPTSTPEKSWGSTTDYSMFIDILPAMDVAPRTPRGKTYSRLVLESYGWPLKMALTPLEVVQAMKDALAGKHGDYGRGHLAKPKLRTPSGIRSRRLAPRPQRRQPACYWEQRSWISCHDHRLRLC